MNFEEYPEFTQVESYLKGLEVFYPELYGRNDAHVNECPLTGVRLETVIRIFRVLNKLKSDIKSILMLSSSEKSQEVDDYFVRIKKLIKLLNLKLSATGTYLIRAYTNQLNQAPIVIGGCGRSGTTLLLAILSAHPEILTIKRETGMLYLSVVQPRRGTIQDQLQRFFRRHLIMYDLEECHRRWAEKTPNNIHHFKDIQKSIQPVKLIQIVRDGRDVIVSKHPSRPPNYWVSPRRWIRDVGIGVRYLNDPYIHTLKYEDIILNFEETMVGLCDYLEISYRPYIAKWYTHAVLRTSNAWDGGLKPLDPGRIGQWKLGIHKNRVEEFLKIGDARELLEKYHYI